MSRLYDYKQKMTALQFTPEQKARLAQTAAEAAGKQNRKRRPVFRTALIAAAMAAVLVIGSSAAGILPEPVDLFVPLFGGSVAQTEIIDKIGHPIGASDTDNGITISADAIMGDRYNAVIVYTISRDDGGRFLPEGLTDASQLTAGGFGGSSWTRESAHGSAWFVDEDPDDNQVQYVETVSADGPLTKGTAKSEFWDLSYWDAETENFVPLYEGKWKLRFEVDYEDCSLSLGEHETFTQDGLEFTINEITISPVAVRAVYTASEAVQWSNAGSGRQDPGDARQMERFLHNVEILLTKTDGTVIDLSNSGGSISPDTDAGISLCTKGQVYEEIIPLDEIASISVGGVVYEIPNA